MSRNSVIQAVKVQPRSVSLLEKFETFLQENCRMVESVLSSSSDTKTFVEESTSSLQMGVLNADKDVLCLNKLSDGWTVGYGFHVPTTDDGDAHFDSCNVECFDELHQATECFMKRWFSTNPAKTT